MLTLNLCVTSPTMLIRLLTFRWVKVEIARGCVNGRSDEVLYCRWWWRATKVRRLYQKGKPTKSSTLNIDSTQGPNYSCTHMEIPLNISILRYYSCVKVPCGSRLQLLRTTKKIKDLGWHELCVLSLHNHNWCHISVWTISIFCPEKHSHWRILRSILEQTSGILLPCWHHYVDFWCKQVRRMDLLTKEQRYKHRGRN